MKDMCGCGCHAGYAYWPGYHAGYIHRPGYIGWGRRFLTREEEIAELERYKENLSKEIEGVERRIEELKKAQ
ncbi:MAG: hypothetical protein ACUVXI_06455 [bacterium]